MDILNMGYNLFPIYYCTRDFLKPKKNQPEKINAKSNVCEKLEISNDGLIEAAHMKIDHVQNRCSNFSIEYILGYNEDSKFKSESSSSEGEMRNEYDWLHCTRYKPPKVQRVKKRKNNAPKRRLGRNPRIPFSSQQVSILEEQFRKNPYLSHADVTQLSRLLRLSESRVKIWFQNRRARERRECQDNLGDDDNKYCPVQSFLEKTRFLESEEESVPEFSLSAFKPCYYLK